MIEGVGYCKRKLMTFRTRENERGATYMELLLGVVCFGILVVNIGYCVLDHE